MLDICMNVETVERKVIMTVKKKKSKREQVVPIVSFIFLSQAGDPEIRSRSLSKMERL